MKFKKPCRAIVAATAVTGILLSSLPGFGFAAPFDAIPKTSKQRTIISQLIESGALNSPTVNLYQSEEVLTSYETDLLSTYVLLSIYPAQKNLNNQQKQLLKDLAVASPGISPILGNSQLLEAINAMQIKEEQAKPSSPANFKAPPITEFSNLFPQFNKPEVPPIQTSVQPKPQQQLELAPAPGPVTPLTDFSEKEAVKLKKSTELSAEAVNDKQLKSVAKKLKTLGLEFEHRLSYLNSKNIGSTVYDDQNGLDSYGNPTQPKYSNESYLKDSLTAKLFWNVNDALQIVTGFRAYNNDGMVGQQGTLSGFDNVVATLKKVNRFTFGRFSEAFGKYNVDLSDVRGFEYQYKGNDQALTVFSGKTGTYGNDPSQGEMPDENLWGIKYDTKKLIKDFSLAFAYATGAEIEIPENKKSIFSFIFNGSFHGMKAEGEFDTGNTTVSGEDYSIRAFYADLEKNFGKKLAASLHLVNIDNNYNSFVKDSTGQYNEIGYDGKPDYPYPSGQKGYDLGLTYSVKDGVAKLMAGISRYTSDGQGNTDIRKTFIAGDYVLNILGHNRQIATIGTALRLENNSQNGQGGTVLFGKIDGLWNIANDVSLRMGYNFVHGSDSENTGETRIATSLAKNYHLSDRVTLTPEISYEYKRREEKNNLQAGEYAKAMNSNALDMSLTTTYQVIPGELSTYLTFSRVKHNVNQPEISQTTGANLDGLSRNSSGVTVGVDWQNKTIPGLALGVSIGQDKVHYYDDNEDSTQTVYGASASYRKKLSDTTQSTVSWNYSRRKDGTHPEYNEIMSKLGADVDIQLGEKHNVQVKSSYEKRNSGYDPNGSYTATQTTVEMVNKF